MTASVMVLLSVLSGTGFASALVRSPCLEPHYVRQVFGILVLINGALIVIQFLAAPIADFDDARHTLHGHTVNTF